MRTIEIRAVDNPEYVQIVELPTDSPGEKYIAIRDDLGEVVMIPIDKWDDFVFACQAFMYIHKKG